MTRGQYVWGTDPSAVDEYRLVDFSTLAHRDRYVTEQDPEPPKPVHLSQAIRQRHQLQSLGELERLPVEVLDRVFGQVAQKDFHNISYVNKTCRAIARSRLFARVELDYSPRCFALLHAIELESKTLQYSHESHFPLGRYVIRLVVKTMKEHLVSRHGLTKADCQ